MTYDWLLAGRPLQPSHGLVMTDRPPHDLIVRKTLWIMGFTFKFNYATLQIG